MFIYGFKSEEYEEAKATLIQEGFKIDNAVAGPCQVLKASGRMLISAAPEVWNRLCYRQGSWYRQSEKNGQHIVASQSRLPEVFEVFLDVTISASDFMPSSLPSNDELLQLINTDEYKRNKPKEWEAIGWKDSILFKVFLTFTRFWGRGDLLKSRWLGHRANHANFLAHTFTTEVDGEKVTYSITDNAGVCSSCVEYFNVLDGSNSRKLVRACPGAITFGGMQRNIYYDVKPSERHFNN